MRILIITSLLSIFISCEKPTAADSFEMKVRYYMNPTRNCDTIEKISVTRIQSNDSLIFHYKYKKLMDTADTLIITTDNIKIKSGIQKLIATKKFPYNGKDIEVQKYYWSSGHPHSNVDFYINKEYGIILFKTYNNIIAEYRLNKESEHLIDHILHDSVFVNVE